MRIAHVKIEKNVENGWDKKSALPFKNDYTFPWGKDWCLDAQIVQGWQGGLEQLCRNVETEWLYWNCIYCVSVSVMYKTGYWS